MRRASWPSDHFVRFGASSRSLRLCTCCVLFGLLPLAAVSAAQNRVLLDRVVATVDGDPILLSDVRRVVELGLLSPGPGESAAALQRRVLDGLIAQRLRLHAVDRYGFGEASAAEVEALLAAATERLGGADALRARLRELSFDEDGLRLLLARQIQLASFVEERIGARVFVGLEAIRDYYEERLRPDLEAVGEEVPPLEEVREQIRQVLREERLNEEIERWTEELRREADTVDHLEHPERLLPPVLPADSPPVHQAAGGQPG